MFVIIIIILLLLLFFTGKEYRIYSKEIGGKGGKGGKSCPEYSKVRIGEIFEIVCQIRGKISHLSHLLELSAQKLLLKMKTEQNNNMKANKQSYY